MKVQQLSVTTLLFVLPSFLCRRTKVFAQIYIYLFYTRVSQNPQRLIRFERNSYRNLMGNVSSALDRTVKKKIPPPEEEGRQAGQCPGGRATKPRSSLSITGKQTVTTGSGPPPPIPPTRAGSVPYLSISPRRVR